MVHKTENTTVLARADFPLSSVQLLTCRHILVAGGGGSANTGIPNGFVSIIVYQKDSSIRSSILN